MIVRNITFSADEELIDKARAVAQRNQRSLNDEFRDWLAKYASAGGDDKFSYRKLVEQLGEVKMTRKYTRDEMNERR
jgi:ribosomal protein L20